MYLSSFALPSHIVDGVKLGFKKLLWEALVKSVQVVQESLVPRPNYCPGPLPNITTWTLI